MKHILSKKIISIVCLILSVQIILSGSLFVFTQIKFKMNMRSWVKTEAAEKYLQKIELTKSEFEKLNWLETNEEFELKGAYYDLTKITKTKTKITLYCFNDKKENELCKAFEKQQNKQSKKTGKSLTLFSCDLIQFKKENNFTTTIQNNFFNNLFSFPIAPCIAVLVPPPNFI